MKIASIICRAWFDSNFRNEKIPTFDDVIDFINRNQINLNLEIKPINGKDAARLTRLMVRQLKKAGYEVNVWTVDKIDRANQLFNWGVDGIFTDIG